MDFKLLRKLEEQALKGVPASVDDAEALWLSIAPDEPLDPLCEAAGRVAARCVGPEVQTCSIINARSGRCPENCKWCAQSAHHHTGCGEYRFCPEEAVVADALTCRRRGVERLSLVCSGRKVPLADIKVYAAMYRAAAKAAPGVKLCASMGLLGPEELTELYNAGVRRYHCNLETSSDYFPTLCTTHTHADKLRTISAARQAGMEVCVGGIIGMGENMRQRLKLAEEAREAGAVSMPLNMLIPIAGTPLENQPPLSPREVVASGALMRLVAPKVCIRFAGGRARLSRREMEQMLSGGVTGAMVGDMLTTRGNSPEEDMAMFADITRRNTQSLTIND